MIFKLKPVAFEIVTIPANFEGTTTSPENEVKYLFNISSIFERAAVLADWMGRPTTLQTIRNISSLVEAITDKAGRELPPADVFDIVTLAGMMTGDVTFGEEEFTTLFSLLPAFGPYSFKFRGNSEGCKLTISRDPKHGVYSEISFSSKGGVFGFPLTISVNRYLDMDDMENHSDTCPIARVVDILEGEARDDDDPESIEDCNCEGGIDYQASMDVMTLDNAEAAAARKFIEVHTLS